MTKDSSNFYQHTASLQGVLHERELEHYKLSLQSGRTSLHAPSKKMDRTSSLYQYWQKILEDERRNDERNRAVLRKWEDLEYRISVMAAKTEKLKVLKEQYFSLLQKLYLHRDNKREGWSAPTGIPSSASHRSSSEIIKEKQYALDYVLSQRRFNRSPLFKSAEGSISYTPIDSGITQMQNSYSEPATPRTVCETAVQTDCLLLAVCQNCGQQTPSINIGTAKHDYNLELTSNSFQNMDPVGVERFSSAPLHSSPFAPPLFSVHHSRTEDSLFRSTFIKDMNNQLTSLPLERHAYDAQQNIQHNHRSDSLSEKPPSPTVPQHNMQILQKHVGTQYSPNRSASQNNYSAAIEDEAPLSEQIPPEKNKMQLFGTRSATLSNVSSISSQTGAIKMKETESCVNLVDVSMPCSYTSDIAGKEVVNAEVEQIKLKEKLEEVNMKTGEDESFIQHKIPSPINSFSDPSLIPNAANFSSKTEEGENLHKDINRNDLNEISGKLSVSSNHSDNDSDVKSKEQNKNSQLEEMHHAITNLEKSDKSFSYLIQEKQNAEFHELNVSERNENTIQKINTNTLNDTNESSRRESIISEKSNSTKENSTDNSKSQISSSVEHPIQDSTNDRRISIISEKSLNSKNQNIDAKAALTPENQNFQEREAQNLDSRTINQDQEMSASQNVMDLRNASAKHKSSSSSDSTDVDEKLNDSDDSFFDKEVPLTETSAYQMLLGGNMTLSSKNEANNDSDSSDDVENELVAAVLSKPPPKEVKDYGSIHGNVTTTNAPGALKSHSAIENSPSKVSSVPAGSRGTSSAASTQPRTTPQGLSKATRKALSLDPDSDSEDGNPPAGPATPAAGKSGDSDSDEFDFYD